MAWFKRSLWTLCIVIAVIAIAVTILINPFGPSHLNDYRTDDRIVVEGLKAPVRIDRDEKGMAYIYADDLDDLIMAKGYVTAMDRLFQMELTKLISAGRIGELAGPAARSIDVTMRTLGFRRQALKHLAIQNAETRHFLQQYADGVNAFIRLRPGDIPIEFKLAGIDAEPWEPVDT
jgi:penicillin amidase